MSALANRFVLALVALAIPFVASCGGGSPTGPSSQPLVVASPPAPSASAVSMAGLSSESQVFIRASNLESYGGAVTRWSEGAAISVYADPGFRREDVVSATGFWEATTSRKITFALVESKSEAQIRLELVFPIEGLSERGCAVGAPDNIDAHVIRSGFGKFALGFKPGCMARNLDAVMMAHEMGHALGLAGHHTPPDSNVMSSPPSTTLKATSVLEEAINWLYSVPPGARPE